MSSPASSTTAHDANGSSESTTTIRERTLTQQNGRIMPLLTSAHERRHPFFGVKDPEVRKLRNATMKQLGLSIGLITVVLWVCLPIFWGSTYKLIPNLKNLNVDFIDFDSAASPNNSILGPAYTSFVQSTIADTPASDPRLGYVIRDPSAYPNGLEDVRNSVVTGECWGAIVVNANATSAWRSAVESGDGTYDPQGSIGIFYSGAKFYQIILLYLVPLMLSNTREAITTASSTAYQTLLASLETGYTAPSSTGPISKLTTSLTLLEAVPQAVGTPFGYYQIDLRPQTAWSAAAVFEAGNIYFLIFAFHLCLFHTLARMRTGIAKKLTLSSLIGLRFLVPVVIYFFMALWYSCIIAAFQIPFDATVGRAGFVVDWALNYVALLAMGLAFETMMTLVGLKFLPFFLIFWIIMNITSSFSPLEIEGQFYRYLRWAPFYHHVEASKIIFFNTGPAHQLGVHFGALFGLVAVNVVGLTLSVWFERWREDRSERKKLKEESDEK